MNKWYQQLIFTEHCANSSHHTAVKWIVGIITDNQPRITDSLDFMLYTEIGLFIVRTNLAQSCISVRRNHIAFYTSRVHESLDNFKKF